jgi:hypothetical protein
MVMVNDVVRGWLVAGDCALAVDIRNNLVKSD